MRRLVVPAMLGAFVAMSCSAIVASSLGDTGDFARASSSGSVEPDKCALVAPDADNVCSTCIQTSCAAEVEYACDRDAGRSSTKDWFRSLEDCAQDPYVNYGPPSSSFYQCRQYDNPDAAPIGNGGGPDEVRKRASELCVRDNCLTGPTPPCRLCPVFTETNAKTRAYLADDPCGSCLATSCTAVLVKCCDESEAMSLILPCAFTAEQSNKETCVNMPYDAAVLSPAASKKTRCSQELAACFDAKCRGQGNCRL